MNNNKFKIFENFIFIAIILVIVQTFLEELLPNIVIKKNLECYTCVVSIG